VFVLPAGPGPAGHRVVSAPTPGSPDQQRPAEQDDEHADADHGAA
jgi:hypothetical protein